MGLQQNLQQNLQQQQTFMMLPKMQQALSVLQASVLDLNDIINDELDSNPIVERMEDIQTLLQKQRQRSSNINYNSTMYHDIENNVSAATSIREELLAQAREALPEDLYAAEIIIDSLDDSGFLTSPLEELSAWHGLDIESLQYSLSVIQTFDPVGIGSRNVRELLMIQLERNSMKKTISYKIVEKYYDKLIHNKIPDLCRSLKMPIKVVQKNIENIAKLNFRPIVDPSSGGSENIFVDAIIEETESGLKIQICDQNVSEFVINPYYIEMLYNKNISNQVKEYIKNKIKSIKWLHTNISQRKNILMGILEYIIDVQKQFFIDAKALLIPMTMYDVAQQLEVHESTITRAVANKYIHTPRGLFPLRYFFDSSYGKNSNGRTSSGIKDLIKELVAKENKSHPLSDEEISLALVNKGYSCARRTVAKYRHQMQIVPASGRRLFDDPTF